MIYLLILVLFAAGPFGVFFCSKGQIDKAGRGVKTAMTGGLIAGAIVIAAFFVGVSQRTNPASDLNTKNLVPYLDILAGLIGFVAFVIVGAYAWRYRRTDKVTGIKMTTISVIASLSALYLIGVGVDHWSFWHGSAATGLMSSSVYADAKDVHCDDGFIAYRQEGKDSIKYRCASKLVLGPKFNEPFIPWPGYTEKVSKDLYTVTNAYMQGQFIQPAK